MCFSDRRRIVANEEIRGRSVILRFTLYAGGEFCGGASPIFDQERRDWHEWNEREERAYHHWLMEERREHRYREYRRLKAKEQRAYWRWRHEHEDWR